MRAGGGDMARGAHQIVVRGAAFHPHLDEGEFHGVRFTPSGSEFISGFPCHEAGLAAEATIARPPGTSVMAANGVGRVRREDHGMGDGVVGLGARLDAAAAKEICGDALHAFILAVRAREMSERQDLAGRASEAE